MSQAQLPTVLYATTAFQLSSRPPGFIHLEIWSTGSKHGQFIIEYHFSPLLRYRAPEDYAEWFADVADARSADDQADALLAAYYRYSPPPYDPLTANSTTYAFEVLRQAGFGHPEVPFAIGDTTSSSAEARQSPQKMGASTSPLLSWSLELLGVTQGDKRIVEGIDPVTRAEWDAIMAAVERIRGVTPPGGRLQVEAALASRSAMEVLSITSNSRARAWVSTVIADP